MKNSNETPSLSDWETLVLFLFLMPLEMDILNALEHYCTYRERSQ